MHAFRRSLIALSLGLACASGFAQNDATVKVGLLSTLSGPGAGLGVDIRGYTLLSFAIGAAYAGIAGGLFGSLVQFIDPAPFTVEASIMMYLMVVVGGAGYFFGPVVGAAVGVLLPEWLRFAQAWYLFVFGAAVVLLMIWLPDGLLSIPDRIKARRQSKEASAARAAAAQAQGAQA